MSWPDAPAGALDAPRQPIYYGELAPAPELRLYVAAYWHFRVAPDAGTIAHTVPPDGSVSLWCSSRAEGMGVVGPYPGPRVTEVRGGDVLWGVRFWPGASRALLALDPLELRDRSLPPGHRDLGPWVVPLAQRLRKAGGEQEAARAWNAALAAVVAAGPRLDARVMTAVFAIIRSCGAVTISTVAAVVGLSPRQLRRRFAAAVGMSPKELARVRRIRASLVGAVGEPGEPWVAVAAAFGYADQAHLIREYRRVVGLSPEALRAHLARIEHGRVVDT